MLILQISGEENCRVTVVLHSCDYRAYMCVRQPRVWSGLHKNKESIADLWLGLLQFYTEEFPFNERVICIRRLAPLTKFEKLWNGYGIAVEDPFDLSHNLGSGLSCKSGCMFALSTRQNVCL